MKRTQQEIINAANTLKNQADELPEFSHFDGTDNSDDIEWMHEAARQLYRAAGGNIDELEGSEGEAVKAWLNGEAGELDDCDL